MQATAIVLETAGAGIPDSGAARQKFCAKCPQEPWAGLTCGESDGMVEIIGFEDAEPLMDWLELTEFIAKGHRLKRAEIRDQFIEFGENTLLSRAAWIEGLGSLVKTALAVPSNAGRGLPTINGAVTLFDKDSGELTAVVDFRLVTKWKTAADSLLASRHLARPDSSRILIVGAGAVARSLIEAYSSVFPNASFQIWNRTASNGQRVAEAYGDRVEIQSVEDLAASVSGADIVACATLSSEPVLRGEWLSPGTHVDLIGAFRPDMREADDAALQRARIFVDSRGTTIEHIGELKIPIGQGVINESDVTADFYDLAEGRFARNSPGEITLFKNGGGGHLDLMTSDYILSKYAESQSQ